MTIITIALHATTPDHMTKINQILKNVSTKGLHYTVQHKIVVNSLAPKEKRVSGVKDEFNPCG